jgi:hypothetical protein
VLEPTEQSAFRAAATNSHSDFHYLLKGKETKRVSSILAVVVDVKSELTLSETDKKVNLFEMRKCFCFFVFFCSKRFISAFVSVLHLAVLISIKNNDIFAGVVK